MTHTKILRAIRFDASDDHVFETAGADGELCVSGAFAFQQLAQADLKGKTRQAFANGFMCLPSFGRTTFVCISGADGRELDSARARLARHLETDYGAPDAEAARAAAATELDFACELAAGKPLNTVLTVHRSFDEDGAIREAYREVAPPGLDRPHTRVWDVSDD